MKYLLVACIAFFSQQLSAQTFNIEPQLVDTLSADSYRYTVRGVGFFDSTMVLHCELIDPENEQNLTYFQYDFSQTDATIPSLSYNPESKIFSVLLGEFSLPNAFLHVRLTQGDVLLSELYFQQK